MSWFEALFLPEILMIIVSALACALAIIISQLYRNFIRPEYCLELIMRFSQDELDTIKFEANNSKEAISLSLIGAVEYFGKKHMLPKRQRQIMAIKVLKSHLSLSAKELSNYYSKAANNQKHHQCIMKGANAAKQWLNFHSGTPKLSVSKKWISQQSLAS